MAMRTFILAAMLAGSVGGMVVLDRIAVVVGKHVIKTSDIEGDLRITEFENNEPLDFGSDARRRSAERLIDQQIIRQEITTGGYRRPNNADAESLRKQLIQDRFGGSGARFQDTLRRYGITEEELNDRLLWQFAVLQFIDQRFRPSVLVTDEELRAYYDQHLDQLRSRNAQNQSFDALKDTIRELLEGERVNQDFDEWLREARKRYQIEYKQDAFS
jgi:hypothetical protein